MSVTIIDNESLKRLNAGKTVDLDFGPLSVTIASEKWVEKMEKKGNIKEKNKNKEQTLGEIMDRAYIRRKNK